MAFWDFFKMSASPTTIPQAKSETPALQAEPQTPVEAVSRRDNIFIALEIKPDGLIVPWVNLPIPETDEEAAKSAVDTATLIAWVCTGKALSMLQQAVVEAGVRNETSGFTMMILEALNRIMAFHKGEGEESNLCVPPTDVFRQRHQDDDDD